MSFGSATIDLYTNKYTGSKGTHGTSSGSSLGDTSAIKSLSGSGSSSLGSSYTSSSLGDYGRNGDFSHYSSPASSSFLTGSNYGNDVNYYSSLSRPVSAGLHHSSLHSQYGSTASSFQAGKSYHSPYSATQSTYSSLKTCGSVSSSTLSKRPSTRSAYSSIRSSYSQRKPTTPVRTSSALVSGSSKVGVTPSSTSDRIDRGKDVKSLNGATAEKEPQTNIVLVEDGKDEELSTDGGEEEEEETEADETETETTNDSDNVAVDETNSDGDNREEAVDDTEFDVKFVSRSTSPLRAHDTDTNCKKERQQMNGSSDNQSESSCSSSSDCNIAASIEQIVLVRRPKKHIFGTDALKCHHGATQVCEDDLPLLHPTTTNSRSGDLSCKYLNSSSSWTGVHSASSSRRTYGNSSYARAGSTTSRGTNLNRYSAPVISSSTSSLLSTYSNRSRGPLSPTSPAIITPSGDTKSPSKSAFSVHSVSPSLLDVTTSEKDISSKVLSSSPSTSVVNVCLKSLKPYSKGSGDESGSDISLSDHTNGNTSCDSSSSTSAATASGCSGSAGALVSSKSSLNSTSSTMHINNQPSSNRLSPRIIRRSINYKSTSPRPNSVASSSEAEDEKLQTSGSECSKKNRGSQSIQSSSPSPIVVRLNCPQPSSVSGRGNSSNLLCISKETGSEENLCCNSASAGSQLLRIEPERCASAEPLTTLFRGNVASSTEEFRSVDHKSSHSSSSSSVSSTSSSTSLSSSSEHIAFRPPNYPKLPSSETPLIVVNKLPIKIKDPYSTESESEIAVESEEDDEASNTVTIRLSSANSNYSAYSETIVNGDSLKEDDAFSEEDDDCEPQLPASDHHQEINGKSSHSESENNDGSQVDSSASAEEQESENEINRAISCIESEVSSLKETSTSLIHPPRSCPKVVISSTSVDSKAKDALRDSRYSETQKRSDSQYDNVKQHYSSTCNTTESSCTESSDTECSKNSASKICDSTAVGQRAAVPDKKTLVERCQEELSAFISKCKDIDEMIGPLSPGSPTYLHVFQGTRERLSALSEEPESDDSEVVPLDAPHVKIHQATRMQSTVSNSFLFIIILLIKYNHL